MRRGLFFLYKMIGVYFVLAALGKTLDSGQIIAVFTFLKIPDVLQSVFFSVGAAVRLYRKLCGIRRSADGEFIGNLQKFPVFRNQYLLLG